MVEIVHGDLAIAKTSKRVVAKALSADLSALRTDDYSSNSAFKLGAVFSANEPTVRPEEPMTS